MPVKKPTAKQQAARELNWMKFQLSSIEHNLIHIARSAGSSEFLIADLRNTLARLRVQLQAKADSQGVKGDYVINLPWEQTWHYKKTMKGQKDS